MIVEHVQGWVVLLGAVGASTAAIIRAIRSVHKIVNSANMALVAKNERLTTQVTVLELAIQRLEARLERMQTPVNPPRGDR